MTNSQETVEIRRKRLRFRSQHRGTKEMDILLGGFADENMETFTEQELDQLEALLNEPDDDIYAWVMERKPIPEEKATSILNSLKASVRRRGSVRPS